MSVETPPSSAVLELSGESTPVGELLRGLARSWRLLPMLAKQDYVARYRSAFLGLLWSVFLPLLQGAVLAVVFTHVVTDSQRHPLLPGLRARRHDRLGLPVDLVEPRLHLDRRQIRPSPPGCTSPGCCFPPSRPTANLVGYVIGSGVILVADGRDRGRVPGDPAAAAGRDAARLRPRVRAERGLRAAARVLP